VLSLDVFFGMFALFLLMIAGFFGLLIALVVWAVRRSRQQQRLRQQPASPAVSRPNGARLTASG